MTKEKITKSSGNVFADMGLADAETLLAKAKLSHEIRTEIKSRKLTQQQAAKLLGTSQAKISDLFHSRLDRFSLERLLHMLLVLNRDIRITVAKATRTKMHAAHLSVHAPL